jgi:hypothetical protein
MWCRVGLEGGGGVWIGKYYIPNIICSLELLNIIMIYRNKQR